MTFLHVHVVSSVASSFYHCFSQVMDDKGSIELYPITFKVFKHTTLPPSKQVKTGPLNSFLELIGYIRNSSDSGPTAPALTGDSAQPVLPRRVLYYTACFNKNTTVQQVMLNCIKIYNEKAVFVINFVNIIAFVK